MITTKQIGNRGEDLVAEVLTGKGYAIIGRNVVVGRVEVDILAQHGVRLVIVEVKTRREDHIDSDFGIDKAKILRLCRAGASYVRAMNLPFEVQIDVALVTNYLDGHTEVEHLEDVALPPMRRR